jgi:glycosyltransferase involved in cell wall biosynthesis
LAVQKKGIPMNLLISNSRASYYTGGTEVVSLHQATGLARLGHTITYLVRESPEYSEYFTDFKETIRRDTLPIHIGEVATRSPYGNGHSWEIWNQEAAAFGVSAQEQYQNVVQNGFDLSITHMATDSLYMPESAPQALHLHGTPRQRDSLIDTSMTRPDYSIAHSSSIHEWWSEHYPDMPMGIFRNGVPTDVFDHSPEAQRPIDVLYVGRFLEHKGITDILEAATPDQSLVIAGSGVLREQIAAMIQERHLNAQIIDSPSNSELVELYKQAKIFACPSRAKEGVLTTMLEAGAAGCTVITTSGSGMSDLAVNEENSLLIAPGDVSALHDAFKDLLSDEHQRHTFAHAMQQMIQGSWSWDAKSKELEEIYEKICSRF